MSKRTSYICAVLLMALAVACRVALDHNKFPRRAPAPAPYVQPHHHD